MAEDLDPQHPDKAVQCYNDSADILLDFRNAAQHGRINPEHSEACEAILEEIMSISQLAIQKEHQKLAILLQRHNSALQLIPDAAQVTVERGFGYALNCELPSEQVKQPHSSLVHSSASTTICCCSRMCSCNCAMLKAALKLLADNTG